MFTPVKPDTPGMTDWVKLCVFVVTKLTSLRESVERNTPIRRAGKAASITAEYVFSIPAPASWKKNLGSGVEFLLKISLISDGRRFGLASSISAIVKDTSGAENEVPLAVV